MPTSQTLPNNQAFGVLASARLFALVVVALPVLWIRDSESVVALLAFVVLGVFQTVAGIRRDLDLALSPVGEAAAVGIVAAIGMGTSPTFLAALVVPPLFAALYAGLRLMLWVATVEVLACLVIGAVWLDGIDGNLAISIFTWAAAGIGIGLASGFTFAADKAEADSLRPYREAQGLIRQLIDLSGNLSSGLDPTSLSGELLGIVGDHLPTRTAALYVPRGDGLSLVATHRETSDTDAAACEQLALDAWSQGRSIIAGRGFAFAASEDAIVAGLLDRGSEVDIVPEALERVKEDVASCVVRLETALLFAQFRDAATSDERQRLAREMHDGVAQDIASLGYLVDALAARATDEVQVAQFAKLRDRVTKVVAEVRQSVMNLRTSIGENESLGAAISGVARHLSEASGIAIQVRLDEQPSRLRPEVEAELFRITQEAINNAVKHSRATSIDVLCRVAPPEARISVTDDGIGLQKARSDSHGLKIMRERARLIGADLTLRDNAGRGMTVSVVVQPAYHRAA